MPSPRSHCSKSQSWGESVKFYDYLIHLEQDLIRKHTFVYQPTWCYSQLYDTIYVRANYVIRYIWASDTDINDTWRGTFPKVTWIRGPTNRNGKPSQPTPDNKNRKMDAARLRKNKVQRLMLKDEKHLSCKDVHESPKYRKRESPKKADGVGWGWSWPQLLSSCKECIRK